LQEELLDMQQESLHATDIQEIEAEVSSPKPLPAQKMHKIVLTFVGIFALFAVTYPIAMWRVSQMDKFRGFHVKSLPDNLAQPVSAVTGTKVAPK
jgi:hypothetical protein